MSDDPDAGPEYVERAPGADLAHLVTKIWYLRTPSPQKYERIVPLPFVHLIINLSEPYRVLLRGGVEVGDSFPGTFVSGLQTSYLVNQNPAIIRHVGVEFQPFGIGPFAAVPAVDLADRVVDGNVPFPGIDGLRHAVLVADPNTSIDLVEAELRRRMRTGEHPHPVVVTAVETIAANPDRPIAAIAEDSGVSHKTLIAQFRRHCGVAPKVFADVYRHFRFLDELPSDGPMPTWTELVARAGYYDQPHFIRVFTRFTGMTPRAYLDTVRRFGTAHPSFVAFDDPPTAGG